MIWQHPNIFKCTQFITLTLPVDVTKFSQLSVSPLLKGESAMIQELSERNKEIFRSLVEAYVETGEPVGSAVLASRLKLNLSASTIRNVMAELEATGLLFSPHISAGRLPTPLGLRFFVDGLLEVGDITDDDRAQIDSMASASGNRVEDFLAEAIESLSGLSNCAGLVLAPKSEAPLRHIEFLGLSPERVLVVIVTEDGLVENRILETPAGWTPAALTEAANYLNYHVRGKSLLDIRRDLERERKLIRVELDELASTFVEKGVAAWSGSQGSPRLIVRGRSKLLEDLSALGDLERIRELFDTLETKQGLIQLLDMTRNAEGIRIFVGAENTLFQNSGCSVIVSPYMDADQRIVGAVGVIGPTRLNYARIVPMVDYTARVLGKILEKRIRTLRKTA